MLNRKDAVSMAVAALLASAGFAYGETAPVAPSLSLAPQTLHLDDTTAAAAAAPEGLLMQGLDKVGAGSTLSKYGITVGGYIDSGYIWNHRSGAHFDNTPKVQEIGGPMAFNSESHNNYTLDAIDLNISRAVDASKGKWDVGGTFEALWGTDGAAIHSDGLEYGMSGNDGDRFHPQDQFDIVQAYVDIAIPVGNGLKVRAGKFTTLLGYETINPNGNAFYTHSDIFAVEPLTHTGIVGFYNINDKLSVAAGVTRGWDQALKDNNGAPDAIFQVAYVISKQWNVSLQGTVGPEDTDDTAHYRVAPDLTTTYVLNDHWTFGGEVLYVYDGGLNNRAGNTNDTLFVDQRLSALNNPAIGSYGDVWGAALYASYKIDDRFTINLRAEKLHDYHVPVSGGNSAQNWYEATLGVTITPMPKDRFLSCIKIRPEVRYDYADHGSPFSAGTADRRDQLTFGGDVIVNF